MGRDGSDDRLRSAPGVVGRIRQLVSHAAAEIVIGAGLGGFVVEKYPDIAGIPTDAGAGIALVAAGMAMRHPKSPHGALSLMTRV